MAVPLEVAQLAWARWLLSTDETQSEGPRNRRKKQPLFEYWTAKRPAKLILNQSRFGSRAAKGAERIENGIAEVIIGAAMETVRSAACRGVDDGPTRSAILGRVIVGFNLELLDGVRRGNHGLIREALIGFLICVVTPLTENVWPPPLAHC